eukprot:845069-Amphidinium_carterae.1
MKKRSFQRVQVSFKRHDQVIVRTFFALSLGEEVVHVVHSAKPVTPVADTLVQVMLELIHAGTDAVDIQ